MCLARLALCISLTITTPAQINSQQSSRIVLRDPNGLRVLSQALITAGGALALAAVKDYTLSGTIMYYWAGRPVQGAVTICGRGSDAIRLDATLPSGTRSFVANQGAASVKEVDDKDTITVPFDRAVNFNSWTVPSLLIASALNDPSVSISLDGTVVTGDHTAFNVKLQRIFTAQSDPDGSLTKLATRNLLIDMTSYTVLETRDVVQPPPAGRVGILHQVQFSDYSATGGVLFPNSVTELIGGQQTASVQINSVHFNTGLTDADFQL
jgi:hypothetical protein